MTIAADARAAALSFEAKKDGLAQLQDGSWVLKLKVHPSDIPNALLTAPMGARFMSALVEIGDDETPVKPEAQDSRDAPAKDRKRWGELPLSQQAAMRCAEPAFWRFLGMCDGVAVSDSDMAAALVRARCGVQTRSHIAEGRSSGALWHKLDDDYQFWLRHPEAA